MTSSAKVRLPAFTCPFCREQTTSDPFEPKANGAAPTAKKFENCLRRCIACGIGFSNNSDPDQKAVPIIHQHPLNNLPVEAREKAIETLQAAINEVNRPSKIASFCSENSEDAVTWTVFSHLAKSRQLRATFSSLGVEIAANAKSEPILFLWGVPVFTVDPAAQVKRERLLQVIDSIENCPRSRTEPDVVLDFGDAGVIVIEVKFKGKNNCEPEGHAGWSKYVDGHDAFTSATDARRSKMYELVRNWRVGWDYADGRAFALINLGPESLFNNKEKTSGTLTKSLNQDARHSFTNMTWPKFIKTISDKPIWFRRYDSDRGLSSSRLDIVRPITEEMPLADCAMVLSEAQQFLAQAAIVGLRRSSESEISSWGSFMKRLYIDIPIEQRPYLIPGKIQSHNLIEVVNQCATIERLVDAMLWFSNDGSGFEDCIVVSCNPTTSSTKKSEDGLRDHDLVLKASNGDFYYFEVSDVVGHKDGNKKEIKDLISLGALAGTVKSPKPAVEWPRGRLFLICSSTFSTRICDPKRKVSVLRSIDYSSHATSEWTSIVEVRKRIGDLECPPKVS